MEKTKFEARLVAGSDTQLRRYHKIEESPSFIKLADSQVAPGELNPVHGNDFDPEDRLVRPYRFSQPAAETQPIRPGVQLPIGPVQNAPGGLATSHSRNAAGSAGSDRGLFEAAKQLPSLRGFLFRDDCADSSLGSDKRHAKFGPNVPRRGWAAPWPSG